MVAARKGRRGRGGPRAGSETSRAGTRAGSEYRSASVHSGRPDHQGVSALAVAPAGVAEILPVLDKAKAAGIPVLIVDTDVNWPSKLSYIGSDNRLAGKLAGNYIVKVDRRKG